MLTQALPKDLDFDIILLVDIPQKDTFCCYLFDTNCYQALLQRGSFYVYAQSVHTQVCWACHCIATIMCVMIFLSQLQLNLTCIVAQLITHIKFNFHQENISYPILFLILQKGNTNMTSSYFIGF